MARWIGAAPRQRGSSEPWMLTHPSTGASRKRLGEDVAVGHHDRRIEIEGAEGVGLGIALQGAGVRTARSRELASACTGVSR